MQKLSPKYLAESFVFPVKLSAKQQKAADVQLAEGPGKDDRHRKADRQTYGAKIPNGRLL